VAGEILGYILLVKRFPILRGAPHVVTTSIDADASGAPTRVRGATVPVPAGDDAWTEPSVHTMEELIHAPDEP
jgi:hypothetical protein